MSEHGNANEFTGLGLHLGNLARLSRAQTRSISAENPTGEKGRGAMAAEGVAAARDLGLGWKVSPYVTIRPGECRELANIAGSGAIQQIWCTPRGVWRHAILRFYWDEQEQPSVECPLGDFFACGWGRHAQVSSLAVCVNPLQGFNCYWEMPFRRRCRITLENIGAEELILYYQINYTLTDVPPDAAYFHAQFRRVNPLPYKQVHTLLEGVRGRGHYVGTYMAWGVNNNGWWGEGEIKFFLDGDRDFPTICGTGTEDYFGGAWCFGDRSTDGYVPFTSPYSGLPQVIKPVRFEQDLRVTIQALGWRSGRRYLPLQDDIASVAYWYQTLPTAPFPLLPSADELEIV